MSEIREAFGFMPLTVNPSSCELEAPRAFFAFASFRGSSGGNPFKFEKRRRPTENCGDRERESNQAFPTIPSVSKPIGILEPIDEYFYCLTQCQTFPSGLSDFAKSLRIQDAEFMIELWEAVLRRDISSVSFNDSHKEIEIGEVKVHFLSS